MVWVTTAVAAALTCLTASLSGTAEQEAATGRRAAGSGPARSTDAPADDMDWMADYPQALQRASKEQKMLFVYFFNSKPDAAQERFESKTLANPEIRKQLRHHVLLRLPVSATVEKDGKSQRLLDHRSFHYMYGRRGVAIVDLKHKDKPYYGYVVSCYPFDPPAYYCAPYESVPSMKVILNLPPGTVTQRTMVYAVRMHPEHPASTKGQANPVLQQAAAQHSRYQARIRVLGHHGWEGRFQRIWSRLRGGTPPTEVCAESWPGPGLVPACLDCIQSWRHSSGHWSAVRARQPGFGYDIRRGSNGIWYATGIFGG